MPYEFAPSGFAANIEWRSKSAADVRYWIDDYGQEVMAARGELAAAEKLGAVLLKHRGFEMSPMTVEKFLNTVLDAADAPMADEVRDWVNS